MLNNFKIESLLSARLFLSPQLVKDKIFFLSDISGRISLYVMNKSGGVPQPLLPPDIALQNPILMGGESFFVFPKLKKILVMIDRDGDENYQPCFVPLDGGIPEPFFGDRFKNQQVNCFHCDLEKDVAFFQVDSRKSAELEAYLVNLRTLKLENLGKSIYGNVFAGSNPNYSKILLIDSYMTGDHVLYLWDNQNKSRRLLFGTPLSERAKGEKPPLNSIHSCFFTPGDKGIFFITSLFADNYGLGYCTLNDPQHVRPIKITGFRHEGFGEIEYCKHLVGNQYYLVYNIDGCSYAYEGIFNEASLAFQIKKVICGLGALSNGVLQSIRYEKISRQYAISFSTAILPSQIYTIDGVSMRVRQHTHERTLGIPEELLSSGEDASFRSHDGLRISARLYRPAKKLGFKGKYPVVFYVHGGPHGQERPNFSWFSMPLIQFLTLNGFAVFVPNARGSTGYGLNYMKAVDKDWGGLDRLDHIEALKILAKDKGLDTKRAGVVGRSYGGFMTLTLASRHPTQWKAACDMFGPYDLVGFSRRLPPSWKTYFDLVIGNPDNKNDREFLIERSPKTYFDQITCPLLVIQGKNDPRVMEIESRKIVNDLIAKKKQVKYLMFENEGHDVLKYGNKVMCYNEIVRFFSQYLKQTSCTCDGHLNKPKIPEN